MSAEFFLQSARLGFRWWASDDTALARALWTDPAVTRWIGGPWTAEQADTRLAREIAIGRSEGVEYWPISLLETGDHVGCCGLRPYQPANGVLEVGVHLRPEHWGRGYAIEAARVVMHHAFRTLNARALFAGHHPSNAPSRRIMDTLGFRYTHDERYAATGRDHPSYRLTAQEYEVAGESCLPPHVGL
jgi:[ribosomal protein S5]-alanine N-acetyltransferase